MCQVDFNEIRAAIREKYSEVSGSAADMFEYPTGIDGLNAQGYDPEIIQCATAGMVESFCGVGNPFSIGDIKKGDYVLDFGCGAGFDMFAASRFAGESGKVCGIDLTNRMVEASIKNLTEAGAPDFEVRHVDSEEIPYPDKTFDTVISNGVINLTSDKIKCFKEIYRVLKTGGRIQFADVILEKELPPDIAGSPQAWSQ